MTTYTRSTFVADVLRKIGVVGVGDNASGDDTNHVNRILTTELEMWAEKGLVDWDITSDIPAERYDALKNMIAAKVASDFGRQVDPTMYRTNRAIFLSGVRGDYIADHEVHDF